MDKKLADAYRQLEDHRLAIDKRDGEPQDPWLQKFNTKCDALDNKFQQLQSFFDTFVRQHQR
jgi:hypothetical protein